MKKSIILWVLIISSIFLTSCTSDEYKYLTSVDNVEDTNSDKSTLQWQCESISDLIKNQNKLPIWTIYKYFSGSTDLVFQYGAYYHKSWDKWPPLNPVEGITEDSVKFDWTSYTNGYCYISFSSLKDTKKVNIYRYENHQSLYEPFFSRPPEIYYNFKNTIYNEAISNEQSQNSDAADDLVKKKFNKSNISITETSTGIETPQ